MKKAPEAIFAFWGNDEIPNQYVPLESVEAAEHELRDFFARGGIADGAGVFVNPNRGEEYAAKLQKISLALSGEAVACSAITNAVLYCAR